MIDFTPQEVITKIYLARETYRIPLSEALSNKQLMEIYGKDEFERMRVSIEEDAENIIGKGSFNEWGKDELRTLMQKACLTADVSMEVGVPLEYARLMYGEEIVKLLQKVIQEDQRNKTIFYYDIYYDIKRYGH